jgi:2-polyprenyl-6-methoxyphenol hydroxylase-like FAD-dependent oxidoreductase
MASRKTDPEQFFFDTIALSPVLSARLTGASLVSPVTATGNYSYEVQRAAGRNYLLLGDAFTFIDPVFSTGVLLAMQSAFVGADTVEACLDHPQRAPGALKAFDARMRHGPKVFSWFIYRLTTPAFRDLFMQPRNEKIQEAVLSVLAGDLFRGTPVRGRLFAFKLIYYLKSLFTLRVSLTAWKRRKRAISEPSVEAPAH